MINHDPNEDWLNEVDVLADQFVKAAAELRDEVQATADQMRARGDALDAMLRDVRHSVSAQTGTVKNADQTQTVRDTAFELWKQNRQVATARSTSQTQEAAWAADRFQEAAWAADRFQEAAAAAASAATRIQAAAGPGDRAQEATGATGAQEATRATGATGAQEATRATGAGPGDRAQETTRRVEIKDQGRN
jgi:hypothetical protein